jgi:hypothetical protein
LKEQKRVQKGRFPTYFEKYLKVCEAIGDDDGIATAKGNIAIATKVAGIMRRC